MLPEQSVRHEISIHALREEGDTKFFLGQSQQAQDFYPRPPRGGRRCALLLKRPVTFISIHALREEGDHCRRYGF